MSSKHKRLYVLHAEVVITVQATSALEAAQEVHCALQNMPGHMNVLSVELGHDNEGFTKASKEYL